MLELKQPKLHSYQTLGWWLKLTFSNFSYMTLILMHLIDLPLNMVILST